MTSTVPWEPHDIQLGQISATNQTNFYVDSEHGDQVTLYSDPSSDEAQLHQISAALTNLKESIIAKISTCFNPIVQLQQTYQTPSIDEPPSRRTFVSGDRHAKLTADLLADRFCIGPERAKATLKATTQRGTRSAILPLSRRYKADRMFNVRRLAGKFATDTLWATTKSIHGHVASQVYSHKCGFNAVYNIRAATGEEIGFTARDFIHDFGAPEHLTSDGAMAQTGPNTLFTKTIRRAEIHHRVSAPRRPNENPAEGSIRELKKRLYRIMMKRKIPARLWCFCLSWVAETGNVTVSSSRYADGRTPLEIITGETPDITEYLDFAPYDWVVYKSNAGIGPPELARWLGVSHRIGPLMSYWLLPASGIPISATTVQRLTYLEQQTDEWKQRQQAFDNKLTPRLESESADIINIRDRLPQSSVIDLGLLQEDPEFLDDFRRVIDNAAIKDIDSSAEPEEKSDAFDPYRNMEIGLPRGPDGELQHAVVKRRAVDDHGVPIGNANTNPLLDTRAYEVVHLGGEIEILTANVIAENLLSQVDEEGHRQQMLEEITDHQSDATAIKVKDGFYTGPSGHVTRKRTTRGWQLCVTWKGGSTDWIALKDLKECYPVELAEYAIATGISNEPAFAWWVPYVMKKRQRIISKLKSKYWERSHKYGIRIPKSVREAIKVDLENGDTLWQDAIRKEMDNVMVAFKPYDGNPKELVGYQEIKCHMIFDVKLGENFRRKARYVAGGHLTETPAAVTYSTVVSRDSVRICLTLAALNNIDVLCGDIQNAYLTAPNREKCWCTGGPEFGSNEGQPFIIVRALYGLKSAGASFRSFLADKLDSMGFHSSMADPDVWICAAIKPDGEEYYKYVLCYVDDLLAMSHKANEVMEEIKTTFKFKNDEVAPPVTYLGARLQYKEINGAKCWTMSSVDYVNAAVKNIEEKLAKDNKKLPLKAITPMNSNFVPELDDSEELGPEETQYFQELIGILRWATEIGRVDILFEVSILSQHQAMPRRNHLEQAIHIFAYLKRKPKTTLYFDQGLPRLDPTSFPANHNEFKDMYRDAEEQMPSRMPMPRGRSVTTTAFVDASHAANKVTRRSHSGFIIFVNRAPIIWYSKRQATVESSTFSAEFIAMKACVEAVQALRFKLRMFGVAVDEPTKILCDNESVVKNSTHLESSLNKKHNSIAYHYVRWCVAATVITIGWVNTHENIADAMTKRLPVATRDYLFGNWTY